MHGIHSHYSIAYSIPFVKWFFQKTSALFGKKLEHYSGKPQKIMVFLEISEKPCYRGLIYSYSQRIIDDEKICPVIYRCPAYDR